jgi:hypothetical protein
LKLTSRILEDRNQNCWLKGGMSNPLQRICSSGF